MFNLFKGFVDPLLRYMDKPWKLLGIIALIIIGVFMSSVYEERAEIATSVLRWYVTPHLRLNDYKEEAVTLLTAANADTTQLLKVDLHTNLMTPIIGYYRGGAYWVPNPMARPLIHEISDPRTFIALINGQVVCIDVPSDTTNLHVEYGTGIRRVCMIGVPPVIGVMVGLLYIGWNDPLSKSDEYGAKLALHTSAMRLATW